MKRSHLLEIALIICFLIFNVYSEEIEKLEAFIIVNSNEIVEEMKSNLKAVGIEQVSVLPFIKHNIENDWLAEKDFSFRKNYVRENSNRKGMTQAELIRSLAHYSVWKKIAKSNKKRVLVMEESVLLNKKQFLKREKKVQYDKLVFLSNQVIEDAVEYLEHGIKAYIISNEVASKLSDSFKSNLMVFEDFMLWKTGKRNDASWASGSTSEVFKVNWENNFLLIKNDKANPMNPEHSDVIHNPELDIYTTKSKLYFYHIIIANKINDDLIRVMRSDDYYGIPYKILGLQEAGGNGKVLSLLREFAPEIKKKLGDKYERTIFLVTSKDSVGIFSTAEKIIEKFFKSGSDVYFAARRPFAGEQRTSLLTSSPYKVLRTDTFLATGRGLEKLLAEEDVKQEEHENENLEDVQSDNFFNTVFHRYYEVSNPKIRVEVDLHCDLFQSLSQATEEMEMLDNLAYNRRRSTHPSIMIAETGFQPDLRFFSDRSEVMRVEPSFSRYSTSSKFSLSALNDMSEENYPHLFLCFFLYKPTFVQQFLDAIVQFDYPKERISLYFAYDPSKLNYAMTFGEITDWISMNSAEYLHFESSVMTDLVQTKDHFMQKALSLHADFFFYIDPSDILSNNQTVRLLLSTGKQVVAPMILNDLTDNQEDRNFEYQTFASYSHFTLGVWSIYSAQTFMLSGNKLREVHGYHHKNTFGNENDMFFFVNLMKEGHDFWLMSTHNFGSRAQFYGQHSQLSPVYQFYGPNLLLWEKIFLSVPPVINTVCGEVFQIDLFSEKFAEDLLSIAVTLTNNKWQKSAKQNKEWIKLQELMFHETWERIIQTIVLPFYKNNLKFKKSYLSIIERYSGATGSTSSLKTLPGSSSITINLGLVNPEGDESVDDWTFFNKCGFSHKRPGSVLVYPSSFIHKSNTLPKSDHNKKYNLISIIEVEEK